MPSKFISPYVPFVNNPFNCDWSMTGTLEYLRDSFEDEEFTKPGWYQANKDTALLIPLTGNEAFMLLVWNNRDPRLEMYRALALPLQS